MTSWIAVSRTEHIEKHWRPRSGYGFAGTRQVVPVMLPELTKLLPHYVLSFLQDNDGSYQAVALLGIGGDRNLYVTAESKWFCSYVPASVRGFPFSLLNDKGQEKILCIDEQHINDDINCPPLFAAEGQLEKQTAEIFEFITQVEQSRQQTNLACDALANAGVIIPWPLTINRGEGIAPVKINGLHRISEEKLNQLDNESLASLRPSGALSLAYAQLFSIAQMEQLAQRAEYLASTEQSQTNELGNLFSTEDFGSINFDAFDLDSENK